jgi:hypothetical protein
MGVGLLGARDGVNRIFTLPNEDKFVHNQPYLTIVVFVKGLRLSLLVDYSISESGGAGTGFDTITLDIPLYSNDPIVADYVTL